MFEVHSCYQNGNLPAALREAADFVQRVGDVNVLHVSARQDENILGAWWVDVIWRNPHAQP